jgi:hypothetical protein
MFTSRGDWLGACQEDCGLRVPRFDRSVSPSHGGGGGARGLGSWQIPKNGRGGGIGVPRPRRGREFFWASKFRHFLLLKFSKI